MFFSATGKDSIVLLHLLQSQFKKVVCCFLYHVKGLDIVEPFFNWARSYGNVEVVQLPHTDLYNFKMQGLLSAKHLDGLKRLKLRDIKLKLSYMEWRYLILSSVEACLTKPPSQIFILIMKSIILSWTGLIKIVFRISSCINYRNRWSWGVKEVVRVLISALKQYCTLKNIIRRITRRLSKNLI